MATNFREGNLEAPTRHPLDWQNPEFYSEAALLKEMERVFGICHGCRRCVSLCQSFPTLFDLVDALQGILDRTPKERLVEIIPENLTVKDRMNAILESIAERESMTFVPGTPTWKLPSADSMLLSPRCSSPIVLRSFPRLPQPPFH